MLALAAFWPATLGAWSAVFAAIAACVAAALGYKNRKHIQEVHVLVNANLDDLKDKLETITAERDSLVPPLGAQQVTDPDSPAAPPAHPTPGRS